ncbi:MAG: hypothetical protein MZV70_21200 [Desulfobacterales bacterium]|nr:hypothetical protein [Desulfobacterales bacterium]
MSGVAEMTNLFDDAAFHWRFSALRERRCEDPSNPRRSWPGRSVDGKRLVIFHADRPPACEPRRRRRGRSTFTSFKTPEAVAVLAAGDGGRCLAVC